MFEQLFPYEAAYIVLSGYQRFHHAFKRITYRAKVHFKARDWPGMQAATRERLQLYRDGVAETVDALTGFMGEHLADAGLWRQIRLEYLREVYNLPTRNLAETWYNSIFRHSHKGLSVDEQQMFVHATGTYREFRSLYPIFHSQKLNTPLEDGLQTLLDRYDFFCPWQDRERDIRRIAHTLQEKLQTLLRRPASPRLEMLRSVFFRNKAAYLVGRLVLAEGDYLPFVLPVLNEEDGLVVDACLLEFDDVSTIFSFNRSYFLVDVDIPGDMVDFLQTILPTKKMSELYNSIGLEKHGKTVLYREFLRHLHQSKDQFVVAPGIRGMVMSVFTLPSYGMVFKVIKDRFEPPKTVTEEEVRLKYQLVFLHDRVGRMADSHEFEHLVFPKDRMDPALLDELVREAGSKVIVREREVEVRHLYVEKKMIPLNIYLKSAGLEEARAVVDEYGKAIKQMAAVNIFPGDMLLKNFGVTRLHRVVFYDYDEIGFLTDYHFRRKPRPQTEEEELSAEPWYAVRPGDIFPEEFATFLIGREDVRTLFHELHGDLFDADFWQDMQERIRQGELMSVYPYREEMRFRNRFPT